MTYIPRSTDFIVFISSLWLKYVSLPHKHLQSSNIREALFLAWAFSMHLVPGRIAYIPWSTDFVDLTTTPLYVVSMLYVCLSAIITPIIIKLPSTSLTHVHGLFSMVHWFHCFYVESEIIPPTKIIHTAKTTNICKYQSANFGWKCWNPFKQPYRDSPCIAESEG